MSLFIVLLSIALLIILTTVGKINPFLAFLAVAILAGFLLGLDVSEITSSIQRGLGEILGSLIIIVVTGAMLGKLVAESGAAQKITSGMMMLFGGKNIRWALLTTGFIVGIPLFYSVGFVLLVPLIFALAHRYKLSAIYIGLPVIASLSVTHGLLPPHPAPVGLIAAFHADVGKTLVYGILIGIPTVILAGMIFPLLLKNIKAGLLKTFLASEMPENQLPGFGISLLSALLPVILLGATTALKMAMDGHGTTRAVIEFLGDPVIVMLLSLWIATYTIGIRTGMPIKRIMDIYGDATKDIAMILLIIGGAGALKQILQDSGVGDEIALFLAGVDIHPLVLGWMIACIIRLSVGSATVAGLTAAGVTAPLLAHHTVDPNLMVLSVGAGSLIFSHVNDSGFWLFKEYFNLSIKDTIRSWSLMEVVVAVTGLGGVLLLNVII